MTPEALIENKIYFIGIAGTGMASAAGLAKKAGYLVSGSDENLFPPMSTMLEQLEISVYTKYAAENLIAEKPSIAVVANALSKGHPEIASAKQLGCRLVSFPQLLSELFLSRMKTIVVAGTHGKTTTTSLISYILSHIGLDPSYLVGGIPKDFGISHSLGSSDLFVIEGDEYDTAYFDKNPKFLHYSPTYLVLNNIEHDHVDIYPDVNSLLERFRRLIALVEDKTNIIANVDSQLVANLLKELNIYDQVITVSTNGLPEPKACVQRTPTLKQQPNGTQQFTIKAIDEPAKSFETSLPGNYNIANIGQAVALCAALRRDGILSNKQASKVAEAIRGFQGVKRRLELLAEAQDIRVFEDFAHHPTAISEVIEGLRRRYPSSKLHIAFDPRNATSRRNTFFNEFAEALGSADQVYLGPPHKDYRIPTENRLNTKKLASAIGPYAVAFEEAREIPDRLQEVVSAGDVVVFMTCGHFHNIQHQFAAQLKATTTNIEPK